MKRYTESDLQNALAEYAETGLLRSSAENHGIPPTTLFNRVRGSEPASKAQIINQRLSPAMEERLTEWILFQGSLGYPPTHAQIRRLARRMLGDDETLGKRWTSRFLARNPSITTIRPRRIHANRADRACEAVIRPWFDYLKLPGVEVIPAKNRYNIDETGITSGIGDNGLVIGSKERKKFQKKKQGDRIWTSIIECISADGRYLNPVVIFKGGNLQQQWYPRNLQPFKGWKWKTTENGWSDDNTAVTWLRNIFLPETRPANPSEKRLLILDGHGSHTTEEFMWLAFSNNVQLLFLPAHTSHVLQPLDLSVFGPLKARYRARYNEVVSGFDEGTVAEKRAFLECYRQARVCGMTESNIKAGWKATGLWPVSLRKPLSNGLVIKNSNGNVGQVTATVSISLQAVHNPILGKNSEDRPLWFTPKKPKDFRVQGQVFLAGQKRTASDRLFLRKTAKAFDNVVFQLANTMHQLEAAEKSLERTKGRKKRRVEVDPNTQFAGIEEIRRSQREAGREDLEVSEREEEEDSGTEDCILVAI